MNGDNLTNIAGILQKYGTSLKETKAMVGELIPALAERKKQAAFPQIPQFFTPADVEAMNLVTEGGEPFKLDEGWMLKLTPDANGAEPAVSFISPEDWLPFIEPGKWEITQDSEGIDKYISPKGKPFTEEELQAQIATYQLEFEGAFGKVFPQLSDWAVKQTLDWMGQSDENLTSFLNTIREKGRGEETEQLLTTLFPDITEGGIETIFGPTPLVGLELEGGIVRVPISQLPLGSYKLTDQPLNTLKEFLQKDPVVFRQAMLFEGRSEETETLLGQITGLGELSDKYLNDYFQDNIPGKFVRGEWLPDALEDYWKLYWGGTGEMLSSLAGVADRLDADGVAESMKAIGIESRLFTIDVDIGTPDTPEWYAKNLTRMLPMMLAIIDVAWATGGGGVALIAAAGGGTLLSSIIGTITAGAVSTIGEGAMEAGDVYNEAIRRGFTEAEANAAFDQTMWGNCGLLSVTNTVQFGAGFFLPGGWTARFLVKALIFGFEAASEGLEEGVQLAIARESLGDVQVMDEEMWQNVKLGLAGGLGFGAIASIYQSIKGKIQNNLTADQLKLLRQWTGEFMAQGLSREEAESKAWDRFAGTPEGQKIVIDEVRKQMEEEATEVAKKIDKVKEAISRTEEIAREKGSTKETSERARELAWDEIKTAREAQIGIKQAEAFGVPTDLRAAYDLLAGYGATGVANIKQFSAGQLNSFRKLVSQGLAETWKAEGKNWYRATPAAGVERVAPPPPSEPPRGQLPPSPEPVSDPEGATGRVIKRIQMKPAEPNVIDKVKRGWFRFQVSMIDDLYALKKFTEQFTKGGTELSIQENPYLLARLLRGIAGKANVFLDYGTFGKQFWRMEGAGKRARAVPNYTGESLHNILAEVKDGTTWQDFSAYLVARRVISLSSRNIETGVELADAQATIKELEGKYKDFPSLANRIYQYEDRLLAYANEMGLISNDLLAKLKRYGDYVPFYRVLNTLAKKGFMGKKMANLAQPIKRIKGSQLEIINPLESIVKNTYVLIDAAERNQVGIAMANLVDKNPELADLFERIKTPMARVAQVTAKELDIEIDGMSAEDAEAVVDIFRPSFFVRGDEVTVLIDGKKRFYRIDPDLRDALLALNREDMGIIGKLLSLPAKWLRAGATLSPDFMVRNPARDQLTAFAYSNYGFLAGIDFVRGLAGLLGRDADYQLWKASGAERSMLVSLDRQYLSKTFKEVMKGKDPIDYVKHPLELFQIISELGETATRLGEFKAGIRRGAIPLEAGYSAREVSLDFAKAGTTAYSANRFIAFFNANIRGWAKMLSSFKEHPVRTATKVFLGITLPSILLYLVNRDDDRWKEIPQWQKDLFWIIFTEDTIYRIPKPFELGIIFGSLPERFLEWLDTKDPELFKDSLVNLAEAGSPGFLPTAALPIIEWITNYSFFRGYNLVPASREKMPPELQYTQWTSEFSKKLGELLNLSPAKIDNLIYGWTGGLGRYAIDVLDVILKKTGISPDIPQPTPTAADIPVIKAFVVRNPYGSSGETVERFYDLLEDCEEGEKYLKEMLALGEEGKYETYKAKHPELLFFYDFEDDEGYSASARYLRKVAGELSELGKKQDEVYKSLTMTPEKKRQAIDEIDILKTDVAHKALDLLLGGELLPDRVDEAINKLGEPEDEMPVLSVERPDIFTVPNLFTEFNTILENITREDLAKLPDVDKLAFAYLDFKETRDTTDKILNKRIVDIEVELQGGYTFGDYYNQWKAGLIEDSPLDKISRREAELLKEYNSLNPSEQEAFLKEHPELTLNPLEEWLKSHPKENAILALGGKAKLLSLKAYNEFKKMVVDFDIPNNALPEFTLPPEGSIENYFKYQEIGDRLGWNSAEVKLLLLNDDTLREWLGREPIEDNPEVLEITIKWRDIETEYDALETAEARDAFLQSHPDFRDDRRRLQAMDVEFPEDLIPDYVAYYQKPLKDYEDDWFLMEHKEFYEEMVNLGLWEPRDFSKVPTRAVFDLYESYQGLPLGQDRLDFRAKHPDLDAWLLLTGKVSKLVGDRGIKEAEETPWEEKEKVKRFQEKFD